MDAKITSENESVVIRHVGQLDAMILRAMSTGLKHGLQEVVGLAGAKYMRGPSKTQLGVRTSRLRGSLEYKVEEGKDEVRGSAGTTVPYGAFHEFGFHGVEQVRAHTRVVGFVNAKGQSLPTTQVVRNQAGQVVFNRDIRPSFVKQGLSNFKSIQQVRAHGRRINYDGRPYLKPALAEVDFVDHLEKELKAIEPQ